MGIATREFYKEARTFPALGAPTVDEQGRLRCGAAVGTREGDRERVAKLVRGARARACVCGSVWVGVGDWGGEGGWLRTGRLRAGGRASVWVMGPLPTCPAAAAAAPQCTRAGPICILFLA